MQRRFRRHQCFFNGQPGFNYFRTIFDFVLDNYGFTDKLFRVRRYVYDQSFARRRQSVGFSNFHDYL